MLKELIRNIQRLFITVVNVSDHIQLKYTLISNIYTDYKYRGADKSLARPTSRYIFLMVRIFRLILVLLYIYIYIVLIFLQL
jgi:hypothetical protein